MSDSKDEIDIVFKDGTRVDTRYGRGTVVGTEWFKPWDFVRYIVQLDAPERWSLHGSSNPHFFEKDLKVEVK
jgi:hypothetical protein